MDVAGVYNQIASDFSKTRYRMWPCVERFINGLPIGVSVCEVGCGNGKNLLSRSGELIYSGVDISREMIRICRDERGLAVVEGDIRQVPFPDATFDHTMSVPSSTYLRHGGDATDHNHPIRVANRYLTVPYVSYVSAWGTNWGDWRNTGLRNHGFR